MSYATRPLPVPTDPACATCRYWAAPRSTDDLSYPLGECRASHPADWRMTFPTDACGVYDRKLPPRAD